MALSPFSFYLAGVENSARMIFLFASGFKTKENKVFRRRSHDSFLGVGKESFPYAC
jgi:hypothetical protein